MRYMKMNAEQHMKKGLNTNNMKIEEEVLDYIRQRDDFDEFFENQDKECVKLLNDFSNQQKWIPVSERLPEQNNGLFSDRVLVELDNGFAITAYYDYELKQWTPSYQDVIAWQPLASPYKPE